eukprot:1323671-Prymnesium_polylepis.1
MRITLGRLPHLLHRLSHPLACGPHPLLAVSSQRRNGGRARRAHDVQDTAKAYGAVLGQYGMYGRFCNSSGVCWKNRQNGQAPLLGSCSWMRTKPKLRRLSFCTQRWGRRHSDQALQGAQNAQGPREAASRGDMGGHTAALETLDRIVPPWAGVRGA